MSESQSGQKLHGPAEPIRFGRYALDLSAGRLTYAGDEQPAEPRVLALIVYLARHRDRVVSHRELHDQVWSDRIVSDGAVSRCVYQARRLLGKDGDVYIRNVPRRGYQFVAPAVSDTVPPPLSGRRQYLHAGLIAAAGVVGLVILAVYGNRFNASDTEAPDLAPAPAFGVLRMQTEGDDERLDLVARMYEQVLVARLDSIDGVFVREPAVMERILDGRAVTTDALTRTGVSWLVEGRLRSGDADDRAILRLDLVGASAGGRLARTPLGKFEVPFLDENAGSERVQRVRDRMISRLGEHIAGLLKRDFGPKSPVIDPTAYRLYLLALKEESTSVACGRSAQLLVERALEIEPGFGKAWTLLGYTHYAQVWGCSQGQEHAKLALAAADRALVLDPDHEPTYYLKASLLIELGRLQEAFAFIRSSLRLHPESASLHAALSYALRYTGQLEAASEAMWRAIELDPLVYSTVLMEAPLPLLYEARYEEFLDITPVYDDSYFRFYIGYAWLSAGQPGEALNHFLAAAGTEQPATFGILARIAALILEDREEIALGLLSEHIRMREVDGAIDGEMAYKHAQLYALAGQFEEAVSRLRSAVLAGFICSVCIETDYALARIPARQLNSLLGFVSEAESKAPPQPNAPAENAFGD